MSADQNKALVRRLVEEVWNTGNYSQLAALAAPGFAESTKQVNSSLRMAFPDFYHQIEDMIAEGDKVVARWTGRGTHRGEWVTPLDQIAPTGKQVKLTPIHIFLITDGKIADSDILLER